MKRSVQYLLTVGIILLFSSAPADAATNGVVISHVQAGAGSGQSASSQEFVVAYNNSDQDVDVTGWCVTNKDNKPLACMTTDTPNQTLYLSARGYMAFVSSAFAQQYPSYQADAIFTGANAIIAGSDTITLKKPDNTSIDSVTWSSSLSAGMVLQRQMSSDGRTLIDTDLSADFSKIQGVELPASSVYEVVVMIDECANIPGIQQIIPEGYLKDQAGACFVDVCSNMEGLQQVIPEEFLRQGINDCTYDYVALQITELLPNVAGSDIGREYIELYNPTDRDAYLLNYFIKIGEKVYTFPTGLRLGPGQYMAFYNTEMAFTLLNTTSYVALLGDDQSIISQSDAYDDPKDDMAWALIGGTWQYTNQMTFSAANIASFFEPEDQNEEGGLQPCAANQYRHPETKRCRLLVTVTATAAACKDGQYRSEETNRCRTIALAGGTLTPCKEDQYRSEETNRCRNLATLATILTPCKDNQYRSEETNRCRNVTTTSVPQAAFAVEPIADTGSTFVGWYALGGAGVLAVGYGAWEWRREAMSVFYRIASFFTKQ